MANRLESVPIHGRCLRCGKSTLIEDGLDGECLCSSCGYVVQERMPVATAGLYRPVQEDAPWEGLTLSSIAKHDMGLSTIIGRTDRDSSGRELTPPVEAHIRHLRAWDSRSQANGTANQNLKRALAEINRLASRLGVPEAVVEDAAYVYRKALRRDLLRGRSIDPMAAAAVYVACRSTETPRTLKDVARETGMKPKEVGKYYRLLLRELDLRVPTTDPIRCIAKIASKAVVTERTERLALDVLGIARRSDKMVGKGPMGVAATALYVACRLESETMSQEELAEAAGVTVVTIRNLLGYFQLTADTEDTADILETI